jgi:DNA mismatch repair protein MutL
MNEQRIQILPEFIANQIAAGEVVQRPESVVKELVENAIDAGATSISVLIRQAGKSLIHVLDNGSGMSRDDVALSLKRHATSKILSAEDLYQIQTLGFRGEALASIASVASVEIRTKQTTDELGWKLFAEPMKPDVIEPIQQDTGTQIFVRNLFYNIPARRKFLRSDITEFRHISDTMMKFALSYPNIRFVFHDGDTLIFDCKPEILSDRIKSLLGENIYNSILPVEYQNDSVNISGFIGKPNISRTTRAGQYLFMNHRSIQSRSLSHAVYQGYEHLIDSSQHPFFVLQLELDPKKVDVNVHPQKTEVKFDDEKSMYNAVQEAVMRTLRANNLIPELRFRDVQSQSPFERMKIDGNSSDNSTSHVVVNTLTGEIIEERRTNTTTNFLGGGGLSNSSSWTNRSSSSSNFSGGNSLSAGQLQRPTNDWNPSQMSAYDSLFSSSDKTLNPSDTTNSDSSPELQLQLWQMHNKYILMQTDDGVMVIDQHIAHERILYEKALLLMEQDFPVSQKLLFAVTTELSPSEMILYRELYDELIKLGFTLEEKSTTMVEISGVPLDIHAGSEAESLREIIEQYSEYQIVRPASQRDTLAASYGCRNAIKAGEPLSYPEMKKLVEDLFKTKTPEVCPHGRPVMLNFNLKEFDRRFGRTS